MSNQPVRPEEILPDGVDSAEINGSLVRKGTVAAFLANTEILEDPNANETRKQAASTMLKELAPAVITIGLHKHVVFKNPQIEQILIDAEQV